MDDVLGFIHWKVKGSIQEEIDNLVGKGALGALGAGALGALGVVALGVVALGVGALNVGALGVGALGVGALGVGALAAAAAAAANQLAIQVFHRNRISVSTDWAANDADPLSDGKQCELNADIPGSPGSELLDIWCVGWEMNLLMSEAPARLKLLFVPPFPLACAYGDAPAARALLAGKSADAISLLVNSHYGVLRMTPLHFCAAGTRHRGTPYFPAAFASTADHLAVAEMLLAAGARLEARDVAGFTPLAQATTAFATRESLVLTDRLLKAGANVQPVDRFGRTPLVQFGNVTRTPKLKADNGASAVVMLLLEAGADAGFTAETASKLTDLIAAQKVRARKYLESLGQPVLAARLRALEQAVEFFSVQSHKIPRTFLASMASAMPLDSCRALVGIINDCQARGRVGAGCTLEGRPVRLFGLKTAVLNDLVIPKCGTYDPITGRYAVCIPDAGTADGARVVAILAKNVEAVGRRAAAGTCCGACGAADAARVCGACKRVRYCNADCQRTHWRRVHKAECAAMRAASVEVVLRRPHLRPLGELLLTNPTGTRRVRLWDYSAIARLSGTASVPKLSPIIGNDAGDILVYDGNRDFVALVPSSDPAHAFLLEKVKSAPRSGGTKAYFMAMFRPASGDRQVEVAIDTTPLEPQAWT